MEIITTVLGGLGLFLFGMNKISESLQKTAGNRLQNIIQALTKNVFMSVGIGALVTMLLQSSSGTSVMVISFVNAGMMNLTQALGVLMGANIGTTITSQLIAFNITEYAPVAVIVGVALSLFVSNERVNNFADILTGVGILFIGMDMMGAGLVLLSIYPQFGEFMASLNNPVVALLVGLVFTTVVQSSSASVGLLQALGASGLISMSKAFPLLLGNNIGTTTTGLISSIGANKKAKKIAYLNILTKVIGTIIFMVFLQKPVQAAVVAISPDNVSRQIANSHTLFNVITVAIQLPFINYLVKFIDWLMPPEKEEVKTVTYYLDERLAERTPAFAIGQANKEVVRMTELVLKSLKDAQQAVIAVDLSLVSRLEEREERINTFDKEITNYLLALSNRIMSDDQHGEVNRLMYIVNDLERIGDHIDNLKEITEYLHENEMRFDEEPSISLNEMFEKTIEMVEIARDVLEFGDQNKAYEIVSLESEINEMDAVNRTVHLDRLNKGKVDPGVGITYLEVLSNLERLADHTYNIGVQVLSSFSN